MTECSFICESCHERATVASMEIAIAQEKHCWFCHNALVESRRLGAAHRHHISKDGLAALRRDNKCNKQKVIKPTVFVCTYCARETGAVIVQPKKCSYCTGKLIKLNHLPKEYVFGKDKYTRTYDELISNS